MARCRLVHGQRPFGVTARDPGREDFERLIEDIEAGKGNVLVVWEISRKERDLAVKIRQSVPGRGAELLVGRRVPVRPGDKNDRMNLGIQAVQAEWLADSIRDNVKRGIDLAAKAGRPHGKVTNGYRRIYHQRTTALVRHELDDEHRAAADRAGENFVGHCAHRRLSV